MKRRELHLWRSALLSAVIETDAPMFLVDWFDAVTDLLYD